MKYVMLGSMLGKRLTINEAHAEVQSWATGAIPFISDGAAATLAEHLIGYGVEGELHKVAQGNRINVRKARKAIVKLGRVVAKQANARPDHFQYSLALGEWVDSLDSRQGRGSDWTEIK